LCRGLLAGKDIEEQDIENFVRYQGELLAHLTQLRTDLAANAAQIDPLTKLPLRHNLAIEYDRHVVRSQRHGMTPYLALLDIDHFKQINDTYGHATGDRALVHVADVLREACRRDEPLFRFGGEEFLLLIEAPNDEAAGKAVDRLLRALSEHPVAMPPQSILRICASCGIAGIASGEPLGEALVRADLGLYAAKAGGRNCFAWGASYRPAA
jgi:diguanylate cyclase (GGDEF)-like protein